MPRYARGYNPRVGKWFVKDLDNPNDRGTWIEGSPDVDPTMTREMGGLAPTAPEIRGGDFARSRDPEIVTKPEDDPYDAFRRRGREYLVRAAELARIPGLPTSVTNDDPYNLRNFARARELPPPPPPVVTPPSSPQMGAEYAPRSAQPREMYGPPSPQLLPSSGRPVVPLYAQESLRGPGYYPPRALAPSMPPASGRRFPYPDPVPVVQYPRLAGGPFERPRMTTASMPAMEEFGRGVREGAEWTAGLLPRAGSWYGENVIYPVASTASDIAEWGADRASEFWRGLTGRR